VVAFFFFFLFLAFLPFFFLPFFFQFPLFYSWFILLPSSHSLSLPSSLRSLGLEWAPHGIRVNGIAPGPIADTEGISRLSGPEGEKKATRAVPIGRLGTVSDV
jgi:peroxisomal 2,4-dienoyl-CoA reductase